MISHQSLLEFVRSNEGREFSTPSRGNRFTCTIEDDAIIISRSTGTTKRVTRKRINLFCDRFNETGSFVAIDYHRNLTAAASQLLALTRAMLENHSERTSGNVATDVAPSTNGLSETAPAETHNVSSLSADITLIIQSEAPPTEKQALVNARVGQGAFRAGVLELWNSRCCITGSRTLDAIRASHIKPWRDSTNAERLDPRNGLPLLATYDALFDRGLIAFDDAGGMLIARHISRDEQERLGLHELRLLQRPSDSLLEKLRYHRKNVFVDNA